uniref:Signal recognition particle receptor subunit alpha homolog n=1 Tax=Corethron hystrix TaxID=216773 RepID=A0A7S1B8N7_9STRA|mmetsp:Transcript_16184/g.36406  ORF Transcript_16184/g.36406 Transcript_16184/m.36406 type:complete len:399 (+) Transcript_16184:520-1716(+)
MEKRLMKTAATKIIKKKTVWHDGSGKLTRAQAAALDRSVRPADASAHAVGEASEAAVREAKTQFLPTDEEREQWEEENRSDATYTWKGLTERFSSLLHRITSGAPLTDVALEGMLDKLRENLEKKNVASDVSRHIVLGVRQYLKERRPRTVRHAQALLRPGLETGVTRILASRSDTDVLRRALGHRGRSRRPFVITVIGINGVGKSTSLAKVAYLLKTHGLSPMVAACDTFRSGAVEQLAVHARCLDVSLFHRGYSKDPAGVATAAIKNAEAEGHDVVLIDTAGRMQNNVPLMTALGKLVVAARPDMVLFVGEALVGNDGLNQLKMFEAALQRSGHGRKIDGIILTKWDTVSEKVGATLTMSHASGSPVVFVGIGQKYHHLRSLKVGEVMDSLLTTIE